MAFTGYSAAGSRAARRARAGRSRHGANYSFEHVDGSRLIGTIVGYDSAPSEDSVHWLLLRTQSYGQGEFEKMTYVQRVDTSGGMPPAQCSAEQANQILRVPFSAKVHLLSPRVERRVETTPDRLDLETGCAGRRCGLVRGFAVVGGRTGLTYVRPADL